MRPRTILRTLAATAAALIVLVSLPAAAATALSAEIVSWQVIGLDHNQPESSVPEIFLVQAVVTNFGAEEAVGVKATLTLGSLSPNPCDPDACVSLASAATVSLGSLSPGSSSDAFWSVRVAKTTAAFETLTPVTVTARADNAPEVAATQSARAPAPCGSLETPSGTLLVERLRSQNRNDVLGYTVDPGTQLPDGTWEVEEGTTFTVEVQASTATEYDEISVPAIADPLGVLTPVSTAFTYEQGTPSDDDIYTSNAGGDVVARYTYVASNLGEVQLAQLIYDCSGNSFHYNADFFSDTVTIRVVSAPPPSPSPTPTPSAPPAAPEVTLVKSSSPERFVAAGDVIKFSISYENRGSSPATGLVISDTADALLEEIIPQDGGVVDSDTRVIIWRVGTLDPGASGTVSFSARLSSSGLGRPITNLALGDTEELDTFRSNTVTLEVTPTLPATGASATFLLLLGWALIGAGQAFSDRRLEGTVSPSFRVGAPHRR